MRFVHGTQEYNRFNRCLQRGNLAESEALHLMKRSLFFCGEDAYGLLKQSPEVFRGSFVL